MDKRTVRRRARSVRADGGGSARGGGGARGGRRQRRRRAAAASGSSGERQRRRQQRHRRRRRTLRDGQRRAPLALQNVEANAAVVVHVAVVDLRRELHLRRLKWVVGGEVDVEEEDAVLVRRVLLRAQERQRGRSAGQLSARRAAAQRRPQSGLAAAASARRPHDRRLPVEEVVADRSGRAGHRRVLLQVLQLLVDPLGGRAHGERGEVWLTNSCGVAADGELAGAFQVIVALEQRGEGRRVSGWRSARSELAAVLPSLCRAPADARSSEVNDGGDGAAHGRPGAAHTHRTAPHAPPRQRSLPPAAAPSSTAVQTLLAEHCPARSRRVLRTLRAPRPRAVLKAAASRNPGLPDCGGTPTSALIGGIRVITTRHPSAGRNARRAGAGLGAAGGRSRRARAARIARRRRSSTFRSTRTAASAARPA